MSINKLHDSMKLESILLMRPSPLVVIGIPARVAILLIEIGVLDSGSTS
jgi:hypothetical protein